MIPKVDTDYWQVVWRRFKSGDQEAFAIVYNHYVDLLYAYGTKLCKDSEMVKDSLQELFMELFLKRERIKVDPENLKFYLILALKRNLIKKMKAGRKLSRKLLEVTDFEPVYSIEFQIIEQDREKELNLKITLALGQLPSKQKEAVYLRFNESLEYAEIAEILEINIESVRKQVHRAIKTIREIIGKETLMVLLYIFKK